MFTEFSRAVYTLMYRQHMLNKSIMKKDVFQLVYIDELNEVIQELNALYAVNPVEYNQVFDFWNDRN